ncbi:DUF6790 family protein [Leptospira harrisiae]|uniref:DoxX family protein n=1 Tax=Leptospira harrisiae TaxID=2023189 RepID=A0A2N0AHW3_9LEPT|nr:DUF6790 family protein [Leptospira harrisiae]PJZ83833.1 hypothetical protein CH364_13770 [Leptospira harrisiae]PKA07711.1 hypothetical protein CH366_15175 [Leptospira harrisiae]
MGYVIYISVVMVIAPLCCIVGEIYLRNEETKVLDLTWKWLIFWAIGIRLSSAGLSQVLNPSFTAGILQLSESAHIIVRELGFANLLMGGLAIASLVFPSLRIAATMGGIYLGAAGILHIVRGIEHVNFKEATALLSDIWAFSIVLGFYLYYFILYLREKT